MSKLTAVEWFWNEIAEVLPFTVDSITAIKMYDKLQQAKAMEREQIEEAYYDGQSLNAKSVTSQMIIDNSISYYNEIYKGE